MKIAMVLCQFFLVFGLAKNAEARVVIDQSQYTCAEIRSILNEVGSIWVKNRIFPLVKQNIALHDPVCNGAARSRRDRICRWYPGYVTAKDGGCRNLGTECSCEAPRDDDD